MTTVPASTNCVGYWRPTVRDHTAMKSPNLRSVLRVAGNMQEFDFESCERIQRNRNNREITVDLAFPSRNRAALRQRNTQITKEIS
jgi:hypothetical protein